MRGNKSDISGRLSAVEEKANSAHKRIDNHGEEIKSLRNSRHEHSGLLHNHAGILQGHSSIISGISESVESLGTIIATLSKSVDKIIYLFWGGMLVGGVLLGAVIYVAKEMLKLW